MPNDSKQTAVGDPVESLVAALSQFWFAGLGTAVTAVAGAHLVFRAMVEEGEKFARRERPDVERALVIASDHIKDMGEQIEVAVEDAMSAGLRRIGVPSRQEIRKLAIRIERLSAKLDAVGAAPRFLPSTDEVLQQKPN